MTALRTAGPADAGAVTALINAAYQVERFFVDGDRTSEDEVRRHMARGTFLVAEQDGAPIGCVYTEQRGNVSPLLAVPKAFARTSGNAPGEHPSMRTALTGAPEASTTMKVPDRLSASHLSTARPSSVRARASEIAEWPMSISSRSDPARYSCTKEFATR